MVFVTVGAGLAAAALLTLGIRFLFRGRDRLLSNDGGSPALRALTATYGLIVAFVLGVSLQFFMGAGQQTSAEADSVVILSNLSKVLPAPTGPSLNRELDCYARAVIYREFPAMKAQNYTPLADDAPLLAMYSTIRNDRNLSDTPLNAASYQNTLQQLSTLTNQRDARIRAAHDFLPPFVWVLLIGGAVVVVLAVAAVTFVDRRWPQFLLLFALATILATVLVVVNSLQSPYANEGLSVTANPMKAALTVVARDTPNPNCTALNSHP
jgi:hypothetical protein